MTAYGIMYKGLKQSNLEIFDCETIFNDIEKGDIGDRCKEFNIEWAEQKIKILLKRKK